MTRLPDLSEEERNSLLRSLTEVGPAKPIGYLPLQAIEKFLRLPPEALAAAAIAQGLSTAQFAPPPVSCIKSGALYVYHREALANLLQANADALSAAALSLDPDDFVVRIATLWFEESHPAHKIIAKAFGDRG
jgi:hypothetical protein